VESGRGGGATHLSPASPALPWGSPGEPPQLGPGHGGTEGPGTGTGSGAVPRWRWRGAARRGWRSSCPAGAAASAPTYEPTTRRPPRVRRSIRVRLLTALGAWSESAGRSESKRGSGHGQAAPNPRPGHQADNPSQQTRELRPIPCRAADLGRAQSAGLPAPGRSEPAAFPNLPIRVSRPSRVRRPIRVSRPIPHPARSTGPEPTDPSRAEAEPGPPPGPTQQRAEAAIRVGGPIRISE
jgi:hypothetical protein